MIRVQLEYACMVWSPTDSASINLLEGIQRTFTSKFARFREFDEVLGMPVTNATYKERLEVLNIQSLQRRRERYIILYMEKIKLGLVPNPGFHSTYNRCHKYKFTPKLNRKNGRYTFFVTGPKLYNSLPSSLRELDDVVQPGLKEFNAFKKKLDEHLDTIRDDPEATQDNSLLYALPKTPEELRRQRRLRKQEKARRENKKN